MTLLLTYMLSIQLFAGILTVLFPCFKNACCQRYELLIKINHALLAETFSFELFWLAASKPTCLFGVCGKVSRFSHLSCSYQLRLGYFNLRQLKGNHLKKKIIIISIVSFHYGSEALQGTSLFYLMTKKHTSSLYNCHSQRKGRQDSISSCSQSKRCKND